MPNGGDTQIRGYMFEPTGFQRDLLYVIAGVEYPFGQEIKEMISKDAGEVSHGWLYPNLDALVKQGYVNKGQHDHQTSFYGMSEKGRGSIVWRRDWKSRRVGFFGQRMLVDKRAVRSSARRHEWNTRPGRN